jgi:hypothetical protein
MDAVPEPVTLVGVIVPHARPEGAVSVKLTTPANPFSAATVIVDVGEAPTLAGAPEDAAIVKSTKLKAAAAV